MRYLLIIILLNVGCSSSNSSIMQALVTTYPGSMVYEITDKDKRYIVMNSEGEIRLIIVPADRKKQGSNYVIQEGRSNYGTTNSRTKLAYKGVQNGR